MNATSLFRHATLALIACCAAFSASAQVTYKMTGFNAQGQPPGVYGNAVSFSLTVATYITSNASFSATSFSSCSDASGPCSGANFYVDAQASGLTGTPGLQAIGFFSSGTQWYHYFSAPAFTTPGVYPTAFTFNPATLTVTAVPEPASWALLLAGVVVVAARRRLAAAA